MSVLVVAEHDNEALKPATYNAVSAAKVFADHCTLLVLGDECQAVATEASRIQGVENVILVNNTRFKHPVSEDLVDAIFPLAKDAEVVIAASTSFGKNLLPRLAALLDVQPYSDVIAIKDKDTFVRPIYAGNVLLTVKSLDEKKLLTIRPTAFEAASIVDDGAATIEEQSSTLDNPITEYVSSELSQLERPELSDARIVVSGGRGLQDAEHFEIIEQLADCLGGAVGASRAAVDAGFVANDYQVGQTGKVVAPELYIAVGISGAIQHLAGMKDSKIIVAINKDADAPIFKIASYGLVGDLFEIVPSLIEKLRNQ